MTAYMPQHDTTFTKAYDMYSLGFLIVELFADFGGQGMLRVDAVVRAGRSLRDELKQAPSFIADIVRKLSNHEATNRPTIEEVADELKVGWKKYDYGHRTAI